MLEIVAHRRLLVCVGVGGAGKTTTAAALAVAAARAGRRTLAATIDPAPRLADALGLPALDETPRALDGETARRLGLAEAAELRVFRVDTEATFRAFVNRHVSDPARRARILGNDIYRQITTTLTGAHEYAALMTLVDTAARSDFDTLVLDTPPAEHTLDFLAAPERLRQAIEGPIVRWLAGDGLPWRGLRAGGAMLLRRLGSLVGSRFLDDLAGFLVDFRDVLAALAQAARQAETILRRPDVGFVVVVPPESAAVAQAQAVTARLVAAGLAPSAFVATRMVPSPGARSPEDAAHTLCAAAAIGPDEAAATERAAIAVLRQGRAWSAAQGRVLARLRAQAPAVPLVAVPLLAEDIGSPDALRQVVEQVCP